MRRTLRILATLVVIVAIAIVALRIAFPLPDIAGRAESAAMPADRATPLGAAMARGLDAHPGRTGVIPLRGGDDALASRLALVAAAERSVDAQYYIWHDDTSGIVLLEALRQAAERGVRVRLLLDDNGVHGLDAILVTLDTLDGFEVRLFNPSTIRRPKYLGYAIDFFRMNRRMHNKALIVDGAAAIVGGRNIGDAYFEVGDDVYVDMDVLATGAVVPATAASFDDYWNSASVFGVGEIIGEGGDPAAFEARLAQVEASAAATALRDALRSSAQRYVGNEVEPEWTDVQLIVDDPAKGQGIATRDQLMITRLGEILGGVGERLDLVSAYFVPGETGTEVLAGLARAGVEVNVLTNALDTTDVLLVHAGYAKYRRALLEADVDLYELRLRGERTPENDMQIKPLGLSGASLHAKTFAVDGKRVFIGSFNFDPRSANLNCEMGFLIDSRILAQGVSTAFDGPIPALSYILAQGVSTAFDGPIPALSYRPALTPEGLMVWQATAGDGGTVVHQQEPGATWLQQAALAVIGLLPIEWML